jgi:hypothetical protein
MTARPRGRRLHVRSATGALRVRRRRVQTTSSRARRLPGRGSSPNFVDLEPTLLELANLARAIAVDQSQIHPSSFDADVLGLRVQPRDRAARSSSPSNPALPERQRAGRRSHRCAGHTLARYTGGRPAPGSAHRHWNVVALSRKASLWPHTFHTACAGREPVGAGHSRFANRGNPAPAGNSGP